MFLPAAETTETNCLTDHSVHHLGAAVTCITNPVHLTTIKLLHRIFTSLISLIFEPPLPMSEPHWLAGKTRRSVTGGLLVTVLLIMDARISWKRCICITKKRNSACVKSLCHFEIKTSIYGRKNYCRNTSWQFLKWNKILTNLLCNIKNVKLNKCNKKITKC